MKPIENKNYLSITQGTSIRAKLVCIVLLLIVGLLSTAFGMESQHEAEESGNRSMPLIKLGDLLDPSDIPSLTLAQIVKKLERGIAERDLPLSTERLRTVICKQLQKKGISYTEEEVRKYLTAKTTIKVVSFSKVTPFTVTVKKEPEGEWAKNNKTSIFEEQER